jgi:protein Tex
VSGLGAKTFEQCAGFLRIQGGSNPLDATGVHPESYEVVEKLLALVKKPITEVMGRSEVLKSVKPEQIVTEKAGALTVQDILAELEKPGRDPRGTFVAARFNDGIEDIKHLQPGMILEGTVSNVAAFGAFVDLGVHQDGLIHVSQLSHKFITDAREVVRAGQVVKVKVMEVDVARKRIGLSMKLDAAPARTSGERNERNERGARDNRGAVNAYGLKQEEVRNSSMADKLAALRRG